MSKPCMKSAIIKIILQYKIKKPRFIGAILDRKRMLISVLCR